MIKILPFNFQENTLRAFLHYNPDKKNDNLVFFQHGYFSGNAAGPNRLFFNIAEKLLPLGYDSLRPDMKGAGISSGKFGESDYFENYLSYEIVLNQILPKYNKLWLIGHSMGTSYSLRLAKKFENIKVICISPSLGKVDNIEFLLSPSQQMELRKTGYTKRKGLIINREFMRQCQDIDIVELKKEIKSPVFFICGTADELYNSESLKTFTDNWKNSKTYWIPKADHNFLEFQIRKKLLDTIEEIFDANKTNMAN